MKYLQYPRAILAIIILVGATALATIISSNPNSIPLGIQTNHSLITSGFPNNINTDLSLAGETESAALQSTTTTQAPLLRWILMFIALMLLPLGLASQKVIQPRSIRKISRRCLFLSLVLVSPLGFTAPDSNADLNGDVFVTSQDLSKVASCFAQDPQSNSECAMADVDEDGDIDIGDFRFVSIRMGQTYPSTIYPISKQTNAFGRLKDIVNINGDDNLDAVVVNTDGVSILLGNDDGSFQAQYPIYGSGDLVKMADMNRDNLLDAVVINSDGLSVLLGNGDGSFQDPIPAPPGISPIMEALLGDMNGDDRLDAVVLVGYSNSYLFGEILVLLGVGDGTFQAQQQRYPQINHLNALDDRNGDGKLDAVVTSLEDQHLLLGDGNGGFLDKDYRDTFIGSIESDILVTGDLNGDNIVDLVDSPWPRGGGWEQIIIKLGSIDGSLESLEGFTVGAGNSQAALGDLNRDGHLDLVVNFYYENYGYENISVMFGNGDGSFQTEQIYYTGMEPYSLNLADVNGDNLPDIVIFHDSNPNMVVMLGNGDGSFQTKQTFQIDGHAGSVFLIDLNNDNRLDVVFDHGYYSENISVMLNQSLNK